MKKLFLPLFALPLYLSAQDLPAVIIAEEEDASFEEAATTIFTEDNESEIEEQTSEVTESEEILAEIPEEVIEEESTLIDPVLIKTEVPRPIELSDSESSNVILNQPWAPKPKQYAPRGWRYIPAPASEAYPMEVSLKNGKVLKLNVIPHKLVPEEAPTIIQAIEPGYNPDQGYQQTDSVSARLQSATNTLSDAAKSLDASIEKLSLLVNSLPK